MLSTPTTSSAQASMEVNRLPDSAVYDWVVSFGVGRDIERHFRRSRAYHCWYCTEVVHFEPEPFEEVEPISTMETVDVQSVIIALESVIAAHQRIGSMWQ